MILECRACNSVHTFLKKMTEFCVFIKNSILALIVTLALVKRYIQSYGLEKQYRI